MEEEEQRQGKQKHAAASRYCGKWSSVQMEDGGFQDKRNAAPEAAVSTQRGQEEPSVLIGRAVSCGARRCCILAPPACVEPKDLEKTNCSAYIIDSCNILLASQFAPSVARVSRRRRFCTFCCIARRPCSNQQQTA